MRWTVVAAVAPFLCVLAARPARARIELPPPAGHSIVDLAHVIDPEDAAAMERRHQELFEKTGVAIVIVTVPRLEDETIDELAVRAGSSWGVGRKKEDRGVVVALSVGDRKVFIATGYGVEGFLTDGRTGAILRGAVLPLLKRDEYSKGMLAASDALVSAAASEYGVAIEGLGSGRQAGGGQGGQLPPFAGLLVLLVLGVLLVLFIRHPILFLLFFSGRGRRGGPWGGGVSYGGFGGGFGGNSGFGGFGGGGFGGGGAGGSF